MVRRVWVALAVTAACLAVVPVAGADDFVWSGQGDSLSWGSVANWVGGAAPSGTVGSLSFPALPAAQCPSPGTASPRACYWSSDDVSNLSVDQLVIDYAAPYEINGNGITLGAGGLSATTTSAIVQGGSPSINQTIELGASQTWTVDGGPGASGELAVSGGLSGASHSLTIDVGHGGGLWLGGHDEVGPVTINGAIATNSGTAAVLNGWVAAGLNATDGNTVTLMDAALYVNGPSGPIVSLGGDLRIESGGSPTGSLLVNGAVTLDPATAIEFALPSSGLNPGPGQSYAQMSASGPINLNGAQLKLGASDFELHVCPTVPVGAVETLITTNSTVSGTFVGMPDGALVTMTCAYADPPTFRINYTAHTVTATVVTSSLYPSFTGLDASPSPATAGQPVTLTATVSPMSAYTPDFGNFTSPGNVAFAVDGQPIPGCTAQPVWVPRFGPALPIPHASCQTTLGTSLAPLALTAQFTPNDPALWKPSNGSDTLTVRSGGSQPTPPPDGNPFAAIGSVAGLADQQPTIQVALRSRRSATAISGLSLTLPPGLAFSAVVAGSLDGMRVTGVTTPIIATHRHHLKVSFAGTTTSLRVLIPTAALREDQGLARRARDVLAFNRAHNSARKHLAVRMTVEVRSGHGTITSIPVTLRVA
jgi:hypothetical protein